MIQRKIFSILNKELKKEKITAITGARQIGKTTAMKQIYSKIKEKSNFITFDDISTKNLFEENPDLFIEQHIKPYEVIFIDEFQYARKGGKILKYIYDTNKKKIFISGSSKPEIAIQSLQYLTGRVSLIEMHPLSFKEFVEYKSPEKKILLDKPRTINELEQLKSEFEEYLMFGGYPDVVKEKNFDEKKKILQDLIKIYLLKEIKDILGYRESYEFEKLLKIFATLNGKLIKNTTLSNISGISWNKIQEYFHVLTKTNIIIPVTPFHTNKTKEIIKTPKIYFHDIGFINTLLNNFSRIEERTDKGEILETFTLHELQKNNFNPKFWNRQMSEVDFILEQDEKIIAIECKSNEKNIPRSIKTYIQEYTPKNVIILNLKQDKQTKEQNIKMLFTHYINIQSINHFEN
jgi:uncharacterized protein